MELDGDELHKMKIKKKNSVTNKHNSCSQRKCYWKKENFYNIALHIYLHKIAFSSKGPKYGPFFFALFSDLQQGYNKDISLITEQQNSGIMIMASPLTKP